MKTNELIDSIRQAETDTDNWYASRSRLTGLYDLYSDLKDALEAGCLEGISVVEPKGNKLRIRCEDGIVWVYGGNELAYNVIPDRVYTDAPIRRTSRCASPYERTRAMVYATGNKWAIENFNATH